MKMKFFTYLICFAVVGHFGAVAQANAIFDDFAQAPPQFGGSGPAPYTPLGELGDATRNIVTVGTFVNGGTYSGNLAANNIDVVWNTFSSPLNLAAAPSILLTGVSWAANPSFPGGLTFNLVLSDGGGPSNTVSSTVADGSTGATATFLTSSFTGVDLSAITQIQLTTTGTNIGAFSVDAVVVTPEPSGLILAGLAVIALFGFSYFRKQQAVAVEA